MMVLIMNDMMPTVVTVSKLEGGVQINTNAVTYIVYMF